MNVSGEDLLCSQVWESEPYFSLYLRSVFILLQILQNLGKADKTTDEIFEEHLQNFNTQQVNATRLHKDINNYLRCIRGKQNPGSNQAKPLSKDFVIRILIL